MRIPEKIKILGHDYAVVMVDLNETDTYGNMNPSTNVIRLNKNKAQSQIDSTLLHEILEALNQGLELRLEHNQISSLEAGIYQVFKDNKLHFDEGDEK